MVRFDHDDLSSKAAALATAAAPRPRMRVVLNDEPADLRVALSAYLAAVARFDASRARRIVSEVAAVAEVPALLFDFVLPALHGVAHDVSRGVLARGHEHLVNAQLSDCLLGRQRGIDVAAGSPRVLATTPRGHRHEVGLQVAVLLALVRGYEVVYLGVDLPDDQIIWCARACAPAMLLLGVSQPLSDAEREHLRVIAAELPATVAVWVGGRTLDPRGLPERVAAFTTFDALDAALARQHTTFSQRLGA